MLKRTTRVGVGVALISIARVCLRDTKDEQLVPLRAQAEFFSATQGRVYLYVLRNDWELGLERIRRIWWSALSITGRKGSALSRMSEVHLRTYRQCLHCGHVRHRPVSSRSGRIITEVDVRLGLGSAYLVCTCVEACAACCVSQISRYAYCGIWHKYCPFATLKNIGFYASCSFSLAIMY